MPPAANLITRLAFPGIQNKNPPEDKLLTIPRDGDAPSADASIQYVYLKNPTAHILVFVSHGRLRALDSQSVEQWDDLAQKEGVSVLLHNYPGYGDTSGPITAELVCQDALQLLEKLREPAQEIVLLGNSVGCGPTMWLAVKVAKLLDLKDLKVVLVSPYTSLIALAPFWIGTYTLKKLGLTPSKLVSDVLACSDRLSFFQGKEFCDPFPGIKLAGQFRPGTQVLLLHGSDDTTIPISHSKALMNQFGDLGHVSARLVVIPKAEHKHTRLRGDAVIWAFVKGLDEVALKEAIAGVETTADTVADDAGTD